MPIGADTLQALLAAGVSGDTLVEIVRKMETDMAAAAPAVKPRSAAAERQARYRARLWGEENLSDVTSDGDSDVTQPSLANFSPPKRKLNPSKTSLRSDTLSAQGALVAEFREAYPKREGPNSWQPAEERMLKLLRASSDFQKLGREIVEGTKAYAISREGEDPKFTVMAKNFIKDGMWKDNHVRTDRPPRPGGGNGRSRYDGPSMAEIATMDRNPDPDLFQSTPDVPRDRDPFEHRSDASNPRIPGFAGVLRQPDRGDAGGNVVDLQRAGAGWR